jgi:multidrug efflux pump subunit AcrB
MPSVAKMFGESTQGRAEIFLIATDETSREDLLRSAQNMVNRLKTELPTEATIAQMKLLAPGQAVPVITPKQIDRVRIQLDRVKLSAMGLLVSDLEEALRLAGVSPSPTAETVRNLAEIPLPVKGKNVVLGDVAEISLEKGPDRINHSFP